MTSRRKRPKADELRIELHGSASTDAGAISKVVGHTVAILREVTEAMYGDPDLIDWRLVALEFKCDGCERVVTRIPRNWTKDGADDLCPKCAKARSTA